MAQDCLQVMTTTDSEEETGKLARGITEARLAACVQVVGPIRSTYRWRGAVERATEWLCLAKTTAAACDALMARIGELHAYDTPEITAVPIEAGGDAYLRWLAGSVGG